MINAGDFRTTYRRDMAIFNSAFPRVCLALFLVALLVVPAFATPYWLDVINRIGIAVIAAIGLNILTGYTGQISIGNAAFMAVGAYAAAILAARGAPFWVAIPLAGAVTAAVGMIFGIPALRLKGLYLAMATLAAHFIVEFTVVHWHALTNGVAGLSVPAATFSGIALDSDRRLFYVIVPLAAVLALCAANVFRTKVGRAFQAIRDYDISAEVMGIDLFRYKLLAFGLSSFYVGVAGALLAYQARYISPENFPITLAIDQLGMIIIGGLGSVLGAVLGAIFITTLPELLRLAAGALSGVYPDLSGLFAAIKLGVFGLVIVLFLLFEPDGMAERWRRIKTYWKLYPFSH
jgi:branched-chain amino acid transport system permease protein